MCTTRDGCEDALEPLGGEARLARRVLQLRDARDRERELQALYIEAEKLLRWRRGWAAGCG